MIHKIYRIPVLLILISLIFHYCGKKSTEPEISISVDEPVKDIDGNTYKTIKIGNQIWMAENLKVKHYGNGDSISNIIDNWRRISEGSCWVYNLKDNYFSLYGLLYNWYAVTDTRNIAPAGWHVPSVEEFNTLVDYLGGTYVVV
ncbi:MAG: fibrobacter succinogenes major paralogous domain-containing protein [Sedimentisphaerales bacterium]|nr:fibrobacter succinogenes major paralogous domain-containing protein [Sedimentisphaerales bacterium]